MNDADWLRKGIKVRLQQALARHPRLRALLQRIGGRHRHTGADAGKKSGYDRDEGEVREVER